MTPIDEIIRQLRILQAAQKEVKLYNAYKGIPIAYAATILTCLANAVAFRVNQYQAVCLQTQHETFIEGEGFRKKCTPGQ